MVLVYHYPIIQSRVPAHNSCMYKHFHPFQLSDSCAILHSSSTEMHRKAPVGGLGSKDLALTKSYCTPSRSLKSGFGGTTPQRQMLTLLFQHTESCKRACQCPGQPILIWAAWVSHTCHSGANTVPRVHECTQKCYCSYIKTPASKQCLDWPQIYLLQPVTNGLVQRLFQGYGFFLRENLIKQPQQLYVMMNTNFKQ